MRFQNTHGAGVLEGGFEVCFGRADAGLRRLAGVWAAVHDRALDALPAPARLLLGPPAPWAPYA